jgi:hypothetical protein
MYNFPNIMSIMYKSFEMQSCSVYNINYIQFKIIMLIFDLAVWHNNTVML